MSLVENTLLQIKVQKELHQLKNYSFGTFVVKQDCNECRLKPISERCNTDFDSLCTWKIPICKWAKNFDETLFLVSRKLKSVIYHTLTHLIMFSVLTIAKLGHFGVIILQ